MNADKNILDYFDCKNIKTLNQSKIFLKHIKILERAQQCKIIKYGLSGNKIKLYSHNDNVFTWEVQLNRNLILTGHGRLHII